jgi:hypothetical protein
MEVAPDIVDQLRRDFPAAEVGARLAQLVQASSSPRIQRCIVFASRGHSWHFDYLCRLAKVDYRDVIMAAEYDRRDARLYDFNKPIADARIENPYAGFEPN